MNFEPLENRGDAARPIRLLGHLGPDRSHAAGQQWRPGLGYTPAQIASAYGFNNINFGSVMGNGAGQTIAIVDAYDDPNIASDLATFDAQFGLPAASFTKIEQTVTAVAPAENAGWATEISLDVEWAHAMAPGANIELIEANNASLSDLLASRAICRLAAGCQRRLDELGNQRIQRRNELQQLLHHARRAIPASRFVASSGDSGAGACGRPSRPTSCRSAARR